MERTAAVAGVTLHALPFAFLPAGKAMWLVAYFYILLIPAGALCYAALRKGGVIPAIILAAWMSWSIVQGQAHPEEDIEQPR